MLAVYQYYLLNYKNKKDNEWMCKEFFSGIKKSKIGSLNSIMFMLIRFLSVMLVIAMEDTNYYLKLSLFTFFQILFALFLCITRPYEVVKDSIIESIHQINFIVASSFIFFLRTKDSWSESYENNYILVLLSGPFIG